MKQRHDDRTLREKTSRQCGHAGVAITNRTVPGCTGHSHPKAITALLFVIAFLVSCADYDLLDAEKLPDPTLEVSSVHDTNVTISWSQSLSENFKSYHVYYDTNDVVDLGSIFVDSLLFAQDTSKTIQNLKPATKYYFRVFLVNQAAKLSASNTVSAITWMTFHAPMWLGDSAISLSWTPLRNSPVSGYVLFRDTTDLVDSVHKDTAAIQVGASDTSIVIRDLAVGAAKRFKVYAKGESGFIDSSSTISISGWLFSLNHPIIETDTSVTLSWERVGNATRYAIYRNTSLPIDTTDTLAALVASSDTTAIIGSLSRGATHWFRVFAASDTGYVAWTKADSITLP